MKSFYLIRHAKSNWETAIGRDFDRTLSEEGHQDAKNMAVFLNHQNITPSLIITSPAIRALTTCKYFATAFEYEHGNIEVKHEIYEAVPTDLYEIIHNIDAKHDVVFLFGHNPSISYFTDDYLKDYVPEVLPCSIVHFQLESDSWKDFNRDKAKFIAIWEPQRIFSQV
jgi:phosphohistidine phosphatase